MSVSVGGPAEDFAATEFAELVAALPNLSVIIEHLAGMGIHATGTPVMPHDDVFRQALTLSRFPNTAIKIHGMGEISDPPGQSRLQYLRYELAHSILIADNIGPRLWFECDRQPANTLKFASLML